MRVLARATVLDTDSRVVRPKNRGPDQRVPVISRAISLRLAYTRP
ncbi:MAG: hypothetical protein RBS39_14025 [Phycisphaerales bacterium]|jgi:hypothetical protein|nr:hypothetical protein [Phycisphaerales bacterium]